MSMLEGLVVKQRRSTFEYQKIPPPPGSHTSEPHTGARQVCPRSDMAASELTELSLALSLSLSRSLCLSVSISLCKYTYMYIWIVITVYVRVLCLSISLSLPLVSDCISVRPHRRLVLVVSADRAYMQLTSADHPRH